MGLSCSFLRKFKKTSKNPSNIPSLMVYTTITDGWLVHALVYELKAKKMQPPGYPYPEVANIFMNIFAKTKIFSKIFLDITLGARYYRFMQKTWHQKSHATVPLKYYMCVVHIYICSYIYIVIANVKKSQKCIACSSKNVTALRFAQLGLEVLSTSINL